ncbi:MAG: F0F1 ATP synthase subunit B [Phycisphaerae bacterium]|nr:F0F1 ATP synthase subunit B [Phycisphaerae bacterium]
MAKIALFCAIAVMLLFCGVLRAEQGAEAEASRPGLFSGTIADSAWTVVAFVALVAVLGKFAWKPLLAGLNARQSHIEQQLKSAEDSRQRAEKMLEDYRQQGQTTIRQAGEEAQRHHQQTIEQTREEVLALRRRAHEEVESARATAMEELWKQTGEIVLRVGSEVLGRTLTPQDNQRLIDEAVTRIKHDGGL